jgi:hypothetical protein
LKPFNKLAGRVSLGLKPVFHFDRNRSIFFCVEVISSTLVVRKQRNTLRYATIRLKWKTALEPLALRALDFKAVVYPKISETVQKFLNIFFGFIYFINYYIFTSWCFHSDILNIFVKISIYVERYPIILLSNGLFLLCLLWLLWGFFIQNYNILPLSSAESII